MTAPQAKTGVEVERLIGEALAAGPTPGPWSAVYDDESITGYGVDAGHGPAVVWLSYELDEGCPRIEDAVYIAACNPENIRQLLAALAAERAVRERTERNRDMWKAQVVSQAESLAAQRAEVVRLRNRYEALLTKIDDAWANYERMGEVCPFEGQPMIYAATLEEIHEVRAALATPTQGGTPS